MAKHTDNCTFKGFHKDITAFDPNGPDSQLIITEEGIEYQENIYTSNKKDYSISFNFCPICGVAYND